MMSKSFAAAVVLLAGAPLVGAAEAPPYGPLNEGFYAELGLFFFDSDTTIRIDGEVPGTEVDLERELGFGDKNSFRFEGTWRFLPRQKVRFMWFSNNRDTTKTLEEEIIWDDDVYEVGVTVDAELNLDMYSIAYEYSFWRGERYDIAGTIGAYYAQFESSISATLDGDGGGGSIEQSGKGNLKAPLPVIGLHGIWALGNNFFLDAQADYFYLEYGDFTGQITDFDFAVTWQPRKWIGFGLAYTWFKVDVDGEADRLTGTLEWEYSGPQVYFTTSF